MTKSSAQAKFTASSDGKSLYRFWKLLIILAVLVPVGAVLFFWSQAGFVSPMPLNVFDDFATSIAVFAAFLGLVALSFIVQYYYGSPKTRRSDVRAKTLILVFLGLGIGIAALALKWVVSPSLTPRSIVSYVARKPLVSGSAAALVISGLILAFWLSSREEQRRILRAALIFVAAFLVFGGPTYLVYVMQNVGGLPYSLLVLGGLIAFIVGVILLWRLIGKQTKLGISE